MPEISNSSDKHYVGEVGTEVIVDTDKVLTGALFTNLKVRKPDGVEVEWIGVIYTLDGVQKAIRYVTVTGDFDQHGVYELQAHVSLGSFDGFGRTARFVIFKKYS